MIHTGGDYMRFQYSVLHLLSVGLITLSLTSCKLLPPRPVEIVTTNSGVSTYIPARPARIDPVDLTIRVLTPEITQSMNDAVASGTERPYVFYGFSENDYLSMAQWIETVLLYIKQQNAILEYYENVARERNRSTESKD